VHRSSKAALAAALCSLALPVAANAATKTVVAGPPVKKLPVADGDVSQFFPKAVKIHAGDTVTFAIAGFHVIDFPKKGAAPPAFVIPGNGLATGVKDAAGNDFWFNGQPNLVANPAVAFGTKSGGAYTGAAAVGSGLPEGNGPPKPWKVKFTKAGTYSYYCPIHVGMKGKVTVVAKGKPVPTAKADAKVVKKQLTKALDNLKVLDKAAPPAGDVVTTGPDLATGETLYRFTPAQKTVAVGAPVTFEISTGSKEIHTITFAKDVKTLDPIAQGFITPIPGAGGPPTLAISPQALYPSDAPPLPPYDGSQHGDGFFNTGVIDDDAATPNPQKATVTFATPGTYSYICLVHPDMHGTVVAQ
jgi:plastocyanin